jgi:hypothetical protein
MSQRLEDDEMMMIVHLIISEFKTLQGLPRESISITRKQGLSRESKTALKHFKH